jgi:hypothetical protein
MAEVGHRDHELPVDLQYRTDLRQQLFGFADALERVGGDYNVVGTVLRDLRRESTVELFGANGHQLMPGRAQLFYEMRAALAERQHRRFGTVLEPAQNRCVSAVFAASAEFVVDGSVLT